MGKTMTVEGMMQLMELELSSTQRGRYTEKEVKRLRKIAMAEGLFFQTKLWELMETDPFWPERKRIEEVRAWWRRKISEKKSGEVIDNAVAEVIGSEVGQTGGGCMAGLLNVAPGIICSWTDDSFGVTVSRTGKLDGWPLFFAMGDEEITCDESEWANHPEPR